MPLNAFKYKKKTDSLASDLKSGHELHTSDVYIYIHVHVCTYKYIYTYKYAECIYVILYDLYRNTQCI